MKKVLNYILAIFIGLVVLALIKNILIPTTIETFNSREKYSYKKNNDVYDSFYASVYDSLTLDESKNNFEINEISKKTTKMESNTALDIGCGTGHHVDLLNKKGYRCVGIDKSKHMIEIAKQKFPKYEFTEEDTTKNIIFNSNTFSLITCLYFTIFYIKNKSQFFENCYKWLKPNGYLVIHLVNKHRFSPIINAGEPLTYYISTKICRKKNYKFCR